jgi:hypothetical protein
MRCVRSRFTAVLAAVAVGALTLGVAGASASSRDGTAPTAAANGVPTQESTETPAQYVQRLASLGYSGWLIPKNNAGRKR